MSLGSRCCFFLIFILGIGQVAASNRNQVDAGFEFEAPPEARHQIAKDLWFGADIVTALEFQDNYDLDRDDDDHLLLVEPEFRVVFSYAPSSRFLAYTELQADGQAFLSKGSDNDEKSEGKLRIEQAYLDFPQLAENLAVRVGRQRYKDDRAWWYDEKIDAIRADWTKGDAFLALSVAREKMFADDFLHEDKDDKIEFYILNLGVYREKRDQTSLFIIAKKDLDSDDSEDPVFYGVQRIGEAGSDVRYWLNAAAVRGHARKRKLRAYGVDSGISMRFDSAWRPFVTAALAYGSGDNDFRDDEDGNFRQTGLQDNEGRTFGITSYNYYGEVIDLELSNLWIATFGIGVKPDNDTSAELVYHYYRQDDLDDELFDTDLEEDPEEDDKHIGGELDLVIAHRPNERTKFSFTLGAFFPGDAYDDDADPALLAKLKFSYRF